jgi:hypothetical protein
MLKTSTNKMAKKMKRMSHSASRLRMTGKLALDRKSQLMEKEDSE